MNHPKTTTYFSRKEIQSILIEKVELKNVTEIRALFIQVSVKRSETHVFLVSKLYVSLIIGYRNIIYCALNF